jgi:hypothetical protein
MQLRTTTVPLEASITASILRRARALGCYAVKYHGGAYSQVGFPDVIILVPHTPYAIMLAVEVKQPLKRPTPLQAKVLRDLAAAGAVTMVAHSAEEVVCRIKSLLVSANAVADSVPELPPTTALRDSSAQESP